MFKRFKPNFYYQHYTELTPEWLIKQKVKFILADLDGTLAPDGEKEGEEFAAWYKSIEQAGVGLIVVSNNAQARVDDFVARYKIVGFGKCQKPLPKKIQEQLFYKGLNPETTLFLGDQLFTDIWCANKLGLRSVMVESIPGKEDTFRKMKRVVEHTLLKRWKMR